MGFSSMRISRHTSRTEGHKNQQRNEETERLVQQRRSESEIRFQEGTERRGNMKIWGTHIGYVTTPTLQGSSTIPLTTTIDSLIKVNNIPTLQTQPLFPLSRYLQLYLSPTRTSLAMVPRAGSTLESSPETSAPQICLITHPSPNMCRVIVPAAASSVHNNSFDGHDPVDESTRT